MQKGNKSCKLIIELEAKVKDNVDGDIWEVAFNLKELVEKLSKVSKIKIGIGY